MKSILIEKPNQLSIIEREIPTPSAGEVRVKVKLAGICGSDSHIYRGHNPFAKYPRVIGHEFFGVIDAVGEGVESARVGGEHATYQRFAVAKIDSIHADLISP